MTKKENFVQLFNESKSRLYNVAYGVVKNKELAEDVLQDAYVKAWRKFDEYDSNKKFINWMTTIVTNAGIDQNRSKNRRITAYSLSTPNNVYSDSKSEVDFEDKSANIQNYIERKETIAEVKELMNSLPVDLKQIMVYLFEGHSYLDISKMTGSNMSTVRAKAHRAKKILRKNSKSLDLTTFV